MSVRSRKANAGLSGAENETKRAKMNKSQPFYSSSVTKPTNMIAYFLAGRILLGGSEVEICRLTASVNKSIASPGSRCSVAAHACGSVFVLA